MTRTRIGSHVRLALLIASVTTLVAIVGCGSGTSLNADLANANDPAVVQAYETKLRAVLAGIQKDPASYHRIPLETKADEEWFTTQTFLFWNDQKSKEDFIAEGVKRYPDNRDSFEYLASKFKE